MIWVVGKSPPFPEGTEIRVDGESVPRVVAFDTVTGWVVHHVPDESGRAQMAPCGTNPLTDVKLGKVEVVFPELGVALTEKALAAHGE